eukprot:scaffold63375_cov39-Prasinocladus_malaysianus.AAC.1
MSVGGSSLWQDPQGSPSCVRRQGITTDLPCRSRSDPLNDWRQEMGEAQVTETLWTAQSSLLLVSQTKTVPSRPPLTNCNSNCNAI